MNILLTGAQGNFGAAFCRQAQNIPGLSITPVGRHDWESMDEKLAAASVVVHAASDLRTPASASPTQLLNSNLMSTAALLESSREHGIKKFVFLSSCAVYGEDMTTAESSLCRPISINGISKHLNEKLIQSFVRPTRWGFKFCGCSTPTADRTIFRYSASLNGRFRPARLSL